MHIFGFFARRKIESGWQFNWNYWFRYFFSVYCQSFYCCHRFHRCSHLIFFLQLLVIKSIYKRIMVYVFFVLNGAFTFFFLFCIFWNLSACTQLPHETGCELLEITVHSEGYSEKRFRNDLKLLFTQIGVHNQRTVALFSMIGDQVSCIVESLNGVSFYFHGISVQWIHNLLPVMELWKCIKTNQSGN